MRKRGELVERSFAHIYDTGGMRRTHLRGHTNILKRLLVHTAGFNLSLILRRNTGKGTPRGMGIPAKQAVGTLLHQFITAWRATRQLHKLENMPTRITTSNPQLRLRLLKNTFATGC